MQGWRRPVVWAILQQTRIFDDGVVGTEKKKRGWMDGWTDGRMDQLKPQQKLNRTINR
jgi:hypothetical protein